MAFLLLEIENILIHLFMRYAEDKHTANSHIAINRTPRRRYNAQKRVAMVP